MVAIAAALIWLLPDDSEDESIANEPDTTDVLTTATMTSAGVTTAPGGLGPAVRADPLRNTNIEFGSYMTSTVGEHQLGLDDDGALVVTTAGRPWPAQPAVDAQQRLVPGGDYWRMQGDGNLVLYRGDEEPIWSSRTDDQTRVERGDRVELILEHDPSTDDGVLRILVEDEPIWTCRPDDCPERTPTRGDDTGSVETTTETTTGASTTIHESTTVVTVTTTCAPVRVPALENLSATDARVELRSRGLQAEVAERQVAQGPYGIVLDQSPPAGTEVACGSSVTLVVSVEPPRVATE